MLRDTFKHHFWLASISAGEGPEVTRSFYDLAAPVHFGLAGSFQETFSRELIKAGIDYCYSNVAINRLAVETKLAMEERDILRCGRSHQQVVALPVDCLLSPGYVITAFKLEDSDESWVDINHHQRPGMIFYYGEQFYYLRQFTLSILELKWRASRS